MSIISGWGIKLIYEPREDSFLLQKYAREYANGKVLDMGSGSGILAEEALKKTKEVSAVDIDEKAVNELRKKGINAIKSDLFENVKGKFDLIIFNPPYLPEERIEDKAIYGGKKGYGIIERFFKDAKKFLNKNGKILIIFSSLTDKKKVDQIIKNNGFEFKCLEEKKLFFESLYVYLVIFSL